MYIFIKLKVAPYNTVLAWEGVLHLMLYWSLDHTPRVRLLTQHDPSMLKLYWLTIQGA